MNKYMNIAIREAKNAYDEGNVPVGAVIVNNENIVSFAHNMKNTDNVSIYHAEILCIIDACKKLNTWRLNDCELYVTLKPCDMCIAAIAESRISKVFYLLDSNYEENLSSNIVNISLNRIYDCYDYNRLLSDFFKRIRNI